MEGTEYEPGVHYVGVGVGILIINKGDEVLLIKRHKQHGRFEGDVHSFAGLWDRPGGEVEFGESVEQAAIREAREEIGADIGDIEMINYSEKLPDNIDKKHWVNIVVVARIVNGEPYNAEPDKHDDVQWFHYTKIPESTVPNTKETIWKYFRQKQ